MIRSADVFSLVKDILHGKKEMESLFEKESNEGPEEQFLLTILLKIRKVSAAYKNAPFCGKSSMTVCLETDHKT